MSTPETVTKIRVDLIDPNPFQQRKDFETRGIRELADSIRSQGLISPVALRVHPNDPERFQLIAGERRLRAHKLLQRSVIRAIVRSDINDDQLEEIALIENVQREDLSPIEEANGYQRLLERCDGDMDAVVAKVGKHRQTIERRIALLGLCGQVQAMVDDGSINYEQAEILLEIEDPEKQFALAKAAKRARMDANRLKGLVQTQKKKKSPTDGTKPRKVTFKTINKELVSIADDLERFDPATCKVEDLQTLQAQLGALQEQITEDILPLIERRCRNKSSADETAETETEEVETEAEIESETDDSETSEE